MKLKTAIFETKHISRKLFCYSLLTTIIAFPPSFSFASEIRLHDCDGNLRASTETEDGQSKAIKIALTEDTNTKAKLLKVDSEAVFVNKAKERSLIFAAVESGDWKLCKEDGSALAFNSVEFVDSGSSSLRVASLVAGSAAVLSGIAIASESSDSRSDGSSINLTEPNQPDRVVSEKPAVSEKPQSSLQPGSTSRPAGDIIVPSRCANDKPKTGAATGGNSCREGEEAPVISPYL